MTISNRGGGAGGGGPGSGGVAEAAPAKAAHANAIDILCIGHPSFARRRSLTSLGLALPAIAFIT